MQEMISEAKKQYKRIGKALFIFVVLLCATSYVIVFIFSRYNSVNYLIPKDIAIWLANDIPQFLSAFVVYIFLIKKYEKEEIQKTEINVKTFFTYLAVCFGTVYIGNIIGVILSIVISFVFTHSIATNPVADVVANSNVLLTFIFAVVIGPIFEELVFRKVIIDRLSKYGEMQAILFSALSFSLFHMNLYQIFYAFGIGLIFGYIYTKTKNIKYTILMHAIINAVGGILTPIVTSFIIQELPEHSSLVESAIYVVKKLMSISFLRAYMGVAIIGIYLTITKIKKIKFNVKENQIVKRDMLKTCYLNVFYILFTIVCACYTIMNLL